MVITTATTPDRKAGVAIFISPKLAGSPVNYVAVSDRLIGASFLTKDDLLVILNQHAPEDKAPETEREKHREDLNTVLSAIPKRATVLVMGDSNLRWHGRFDNEHDIFSFCSVRDGGPCTIPGSARGRTLTGLKKV